MGSIPTWGTPVSFNGRTQAFEARCGGSIPSAGTMISSEFKQLALKSLVWRCVSLVSTLAITALVTGSILVGGLVAALDGLVTMVLLYPAFELWWKKRFG